MKCGVPSKMACKVARVARITRSAWRAEREAHQCLEHDIDAPLRGPWCGGAPGRAPPQQALVHLPADIGEELHRISPLRLGAMLNPRPPASTPLGVWRRPSGTLGPRGAPTPELRKREGPSPWP